jgi:NAD(P)-dependent dehydrogenase (short-subunit alcohol dehydrogenase family)
MANTGNFAGAAAKWSVFVEGISPSHQTAPKECAMNDFSPRRRQLLGLLAASGLVPAAVAQTGQKTSQPAVSDHKKRIFITGSSAGLGQMAARLLIDQGFEVVLHGRNEKRAADAMATAPGAQNVLIGDFTSLKQIRHLAEQANALGRFDAVIHNAGVGNETPHTFTEDGLTTLLSVNVIAPYLLTAQMLPAERLIYISSSLHREARAQIAMDDPLWKQRVWNGLIAYNESKLFIAMLAFAVARLWPEVRANAVDPGWVATRMGGRWASDDLGQGHLTQVWLASSQSTAAAVSGKFFYHLRERATNPDLGNLMLQNRFLAMCEKFTGVALPRSLDAI